MRFWNAGKVSDFMAQRAEKEEGSCMGGGGSFYTPSAHRSSVDDVPRHKKVDRSDAGGAQLIRSWPVPL